MPSDDIYDRPLSMRPRLVKLGVKADQRISLVGLDEPDFTQDLGAAGASVSRRLRPELDIIFFYVQSISELERLRELRRYIKPNGAIWVIRRKGKAAAIKDVDVIEAGLAARMVDNKIVAFSEELAAMRLVIRLVDR